VRRFEQQRYVEAEEAYKASTSDPEIAPRALNGLGHMLDIQGRSVEAESAFRAAIATADQGFSRLATLNLAKVLAREGRLGEAEELLGQGVEGETPESRSEALAVLGTVRYQQGRLAEAEDCFRQALREGDAKIARIAEENLALVARASERARGGRRRRPRRPFRGR